MFLDLCYDRLVKHQRRLGNTRVECNRNIFICRFVRVFRWFWRGRWGLRWRTMRWSQPRWNWWWRYWALLQPRAEWQSRRGRFWSQRKHCQYIQQWRNYFATTENWETRCEDRWSGSWTVIESIFEQREHWFLLSAICSVVAVSCFCSFFCDFWSF